MRRGRIFPLTYRDYWLVTPAPSTGLTINSATISRNVGKKARYGSAENVHMTEAKISVFSYQIRSTLQVLSKRIFELGVPQRHLSGCFLHQQQSRLYLEAFFLIIKLFKYKIEWSFSQMQNFYNSNGFIG